MDAPSRLACSCRMLVLILTLLPVSYEMCTFPEFMQNKANDRNWNGKVQNQYMEFSMDIGVNGSKMTVSSSEHRVTSYERICLQELSNNTFVVIHEEPRQRSQKYICMQFIQRSHSVVQLKVSEIASSMNDICNAATLRLDPWLIVDRNSISETPQLCPIDGGFSVKLYDKEYGSSFCDAYKDHVWIESECLAGTGMYFNFRFTRCIPNVRMSNRQWTRCYSNWTEETYSYVILGHDTHSYIWLLRYPSDFRQRSSFVAHLMKDLYAGSNSLITEIDSYVQLDMVWDVAHPVTSLCVDEYEGCSYYGDPCTGGGSMALTCPRMCGVCNSTRPLLCEFDATWRGDWIDAFHVDHNTATFEAQMMIVTYNKVQQTFHCVHWDEPYNGRPEKHTIYKMLVTDFENGCHPQYSCVKITHIEYSPVMFLQISSERHWPFTRNISEPLSCDKFEFKGDDSHHLISNRYRSKQQRMLYSKALDRRTMCNMPLGDARNFSVTLSDDTMCTGYILPSTSGSSVSVRVRDCSDKNSPVILQIPGEHTCIESSRLFDSNQVVVSRTDREPYEMFCWLFPNRDREQFYLVEAAHCNDNTKRRISRGHIQPLAAFMMNDEVATTVGNIRVRHRPKLFNINRNQREDLESTTIAGDTTENSSPPIMGSNTTDTQEPINPAVYVTPVIVVAVILLLAILPCSCGK